MRGERRALLSSLDLQPTVDKVEQGVALDFAQYSLLRDSADAKLMAQMHKVNATQQAGMPADQAAKRAGPAHPSR